MCTILGHRSRYWKEILMEDEVERIEAIEQEMPNLSMGELERRHKLQDGSWESILAIEEIQKRESERMDTKTENQVAWSGTGGDGKRHAWVKPSPPGEPGRWLVWRRKEDGSFDLVTAFYRRKSADRACRLYETKGKMKGFNF